MQVSEFVAGRRRRPVLWLAALVLFCAGAMAAVAQVRGPAPDFQLSLRLEVVNGMGSRQRAFVASGTNEFCLLTPKDYSVSLDGKDTLVLAAPDNLTFVTVTRVEVGSVPGKDPTADECRNALLAGYPGARILEEFVLGAGDRQGPAFDFIWSDSNKQPRRFRVAYVPGRVGLLRFALATTGERFPVARFDLNSVMGTLVAGQKGRLQVPPLSNLF